MAHRAITNVIVFILYCREKMRYDGKACKNKPGFNYGYAFFYRALFNLGKIGYVFLVELWIFDFVKIFIHNGAKVF